MAVILEGVSGALALAQAVGGVGKAAPQRLICPAISSHVPLALLDAPKSGTDGKGLFANINKNYRIEKRYEPHNKQQLRRVVKKELLVAR
jgi:hypothetical protein